MIPITSTDDEQSAAWLRAIEFAHTALAAVLANYDNTEEQLLLLTEQDFFSVVCRHFPGERLTGYEWYWMWSETRRLLGGYQPVVHHGKRDIFTVLEPQ